MRTATVLASVATLVALVAPAHKAPQGVTRAEFNRVVTVLQSDLARHERAIATLLRRTCQEDMPCWDCHTMGNKVCG